MFTIPEYDIQELKESIINEMLIEEILNVLAKTGKKSRSNRPVKIGVLDTGIVKNYENLLPIVGVENFSGADSWVDVNDTHHGTLVASIISGCFLSNDSLSLPNFELYVAKVFDEDDELVCRESALDRGIKWLSEDVQVDIINISLGYSSCARKIHMSIKSASKNCVIICGAGNIVARAPEVGSLDYPGAFQETIAVGAVHSNKKLFGTANGVLLDFVELGVEVTARSPIGLLGGSGSSMASAVFSYKLGLYFDYLLSGGKPLPNFLRLKRTLIEKAEDLGVCGKDFDYGYGKIIFDNLF